MAGITITGVGLATAQGSAARLRAGGEPAAPAALPWPVRASAQARSYRPVRDAEGTGMARLAELARRALAECGWRAGEPIVLASCNGGATTFERDDWRASFELGRALGVPGAPVASAACASGVHALYLARCLVEAGASSAVVLAVDIATQPSCENFESLRIVADELAPYQPEASGFVVGEAAVALRIVRGASADGGAGNHGAGNGGGGRADGGAGNHGAGNGGGGGDDAGGGGGDAGGGGGDAGGGGGDAGGGGGDAGGGGGGVSLVGPVLGHDLADDDGLARVLATIAPTIDEGLRGTGTNTVRTGQTGSYTVRTGYGSGVVDRAAPTDRERLSSVASGAAAANLARSSFDLVLGQATGPAAADRAELAAIAAHVGASVPLATASHHFGHALGASSLLSIALAVLARDGIPHALALPHATASDGRPLVAAAARAREVLVACRALGGACGAAIVGEHGASGARAVGGERGAPGERAVHRAASDGWRTPAAPPPMRHPWLRALAAAAPERRPDASPDLLVVTLEAPLQPPADAWIGTRLLPSSVLELTPGFVAQLVARTWGFAGPAVTLVGGEPGELLAAARRTHERVCHVAIRGMDDHRDVEWNA